MEKEKDMIMGVSIPSFIIACLIALGIFGLVAAYDYFDSKIVDDDFICKHLAFVEEVNSTKELNMFPKLTDALINLEYSWNVDIPQFFEKDGLFVKRAEDGELMRCQLPATMCMYDTYCVKIDMFVDFNETDWHDWYHG